MNMWKLPEKLLYYFLYFCLMSFLGWIIETIYRSSKEKRLVNAGFLYGPFLPIYGFGAVVITFINAELQTLPPAAAWTITLLSPTVIEYVGACIMEKIFGLKLWNYDNRFLNLQGRICLKFSLCWAFCAALLVLVIQPRVWTRIDIGGPYLSYFWAGAFFAYLVIDIFHSARSLFNFRAFRNDLAALIEKGRAYQPVFETLFDKRMKIKLPPDIRRIMRPLSAFSGIRAGFKDSLPAFPEKIKQELENRFWKIPRERRQNLWNIFKSDHLIKILAEHQRVRQESVTTHTVRLCVKTEEALLAPYASTPGIALTDVSARINPAIVEYLLAEIADVPVHNKIIVEVSAGDTGTLGDEKLAALRGLLCAETGKQAARIMRENRRLRLSAAVMFAAGLLFISAKALFPSLSAKFSLDELRIIAGWVFVWRGVENLSFTLVSNNRRKMKLLQLFQAEYRAG
ncbi:MAG: putative ABC transporter permease [Spirochaetaceae bacterium]|jgi:uncharacterized membrane protein|nr:putative ABC transporter permease [Spirochaetaceae bacterium]